MLLTWLGGTGPLHTCTKIRWKHIIESDRRRCDGLVRGDACEAACYGGCAALGSVTHCCKYGHVQRRYSAQQCNMHLHVRQEDEWSEVMSKDEWMDGCMYDEIFFVLPNGESFESLLLVHHTHRGEHVVLKTISSV